MSEICTLVETSSYLNISCCLLAPRSELFSAEVVNHWGFGGVVFFVLPTLLTAVMLAIYIEECVYVLSNGESKSLINSILWIMCTFPAIMVIGTIAIFVPRAVVYLSFMYGMFVAFADYKMYRLVMTFSGGIKPFVDKSCNQIIRLNQFPCCCFLCLPKVNNSIRITRSIQWLIQQNIILTPFYGLLAVLLMSDEKLYSLTGVSASVYLAILSAISTLLCMYGFKLLSVFTKSVSGIEKVHSIKGKTICMQLMVFITGFEEIIFDTLDQFEVFPCIKPLDFYSRTKVIFNYAVVLQTFFVGLLARHYFRRENDVKRQAVLDTNVFNLYRPSVAAASVATYLPNVEVVEDQTEKKLD